MQQRQPIRDPRSLVGFVFGVVANDLFARSLLGPQLFSWSTRIVVDDRIGGIEDVLGRAVVLLKHHGGGLGEGVFEIENIANIGLTEPIDGLVGITNHTNIASGARQQQNEFVLYRVRVLILVDQNVLKAALPGLEHIRVTLKQLHGDAQQVIEVHGTGSLEPTLVLNENVADATLMGGVSGRQEFGSGAALVFGCADRRVHRTWRVAFGVDVQIAQHVAGEADRVGVVIDRERRWVPNGFGFATQDAHTRRVEGRYPHALGNRPDQPFDPAPHFGRGLIGKGDRQDRKRRHAFFLDEPGNAVGKHPGLARPCAGDDQQRAGVVQHRFFLIGVQPVEDFNTHGSSFWRKWSSTSSIAWFVG